ncbi:MAG TPA: hypothetical protein VGO40_16335 [Longimicrobium sp.]|jgi:hypothetical protein|nr:hypothetical protein [Longimicrobium sp.]
MKKTKLRLDDLSVESFDTAVPDRGRTGTVRAHAQTIDGPTCDGRQTCWDSCDGVCGTYFCVTNFDSCGQQSCVYTCTCNPYDNCP